MKGTEDRARLLVSYCRDVRRLDRFGLVRQAGALSSFHIPNGFVVMDPAQHVEKSTTIVGDWFTAEAVSAAVGKGYRHTIFTRHAPTVRAALDEFDEEFNSLLQPGWTLENCRAKTIEALETLLAELGGPVGMA